MENGEGIVIGCDRNLEPLLSWWWEHYSTHNSYPVAIANFGMSPSALSWCGKRGVCFPVPPLQAPLKAVDPARKALWEDHYGKGIWTYRAILFHKALAFTCSPFSRSLWLDLDCQVRGNLEPLFHPIRHGRQIALCKESGETQKIQRKKGFLSSEEITYNTGVVSFQKNADILHCWAEEIQERNEEFVLDQHALARAIRRCPPLLEELPDLYNWSAWKGVCPHALIYHFHGGFLKEELLARQRFKELIKNHAN